MKPLVGLAEGQVLQRIGTRGASATLTGVCAESGPVFVTVGSGGSVLKGWRERRVGEAANGRFEAELAGVPAGGAYWMELRCGRAKARVKAFYVGDVWLLAGQSNMQGVGDMEGAAKPHALIRAFSMRREWRRAEDPLHVLGESPDRCHAGERQITVEQGEALRRTEKKGVGVGVFFAREMLERSGVPQGLIATAHGGTTMAQWDPALKNRGGESMYGSMLLSWRATGQPVAGVLWYQGESDADEASAEVYTERMRTLVAAVRRDLKQPTLPWLMVQLGVVMAGVGGPRWNNIQEQQRLLPKKIKNLDVVTAVDLSLDDHIHIGAAAFPKLADRLARAADRLVYGNRREAPMPKLKAIIPPEGKKAPGVITVVYENVPGGLSAAGEPRGYALVSGEGKDLGLIYKVTLHGNAARLHFEPNLILPGDIRLAYGHGRMPVCTLTDGRGCALPVFEAQVFLKPTAFLPFVTTWRVTPPVASPVAALGELTCPDVEALGAVARTYGIDGFANEHPRWKGKAGHGYFAAKLTLAEAMKLDFMLGYDGSFRLWIDGEAFYTDLDGINPCVADEFSKTTTLAKGEHTITVAMDLNGGAAWGFFLRLRRANLTPKEIREGKFERPVYSV